MLENVTLSVEGAILAHKSCTLSAGAEEAVRDATFSLGWNGAGLPARPDQKATVSIGGALWLTGYVRDVLPSHDGEARDYEVTVISRTCDAVECSIDHATGFVRNADLKKVAKTFDSHGVGIEGDVKTETKPRHKVRPGESLFATIEQDARNQGVLIHDTEKGRLKLAQKPEGDHSGALALGVNIISGSARLSGETRFSRLKGRGQNSEGSNATALHPEAELSLDNPGRKRVLIRIFEGEVSQGKLKKRVEWEAKRASGDGTSCSLTVPGWRDQGGRIWTRNFLVSVEDGWLGINQQMVIASVALDQDAEGGTTASLELKDPRSLGGDNPRGKSGAGWKSPGAKPAKYREEKS